jgi:probable HAF family extracellular repeat protein
MLLMLGGRRWRAAAAVTATAVAALATNATVPATAATERPAATPGGITVTRLLGPGGEPLVEATEVNERGQVLGRVARPDVGPFPFSLAVLWHRGTARLVEPPASPLPPTDGILTVPADISDRGAIAGARIHVSGFLRWPFAWAGGRYTALVPEVIDQTTSATATAINEHGEVLGGIQRAVPDPDAPFGFVVDPSLVVWKDGRPVATSDADAVPVDLNDRGRAVVDLFTDLETLSREAAVWRIGGAVTPLGTLGGAQSSGLAINERGDVVGTSETAAGDDHAFIWRRSDGRDGRMVDLGTLGGTTTLIGSPQDGPAWFPIADHALNDRGDVVGTSTTAAGTERAFLWRDGRMTALGTLGGAGSRAIAIDERGRIVGTSQTSAGVWHAFLWRNGRMTDIGALAAPGSSAAVDISDDGRIVGRAAAIGGVLWTL